jgi:hypothetical protein
VQAPWSGSMVIAGSPRASRAVSRPRVECNILATGWGAGLT